MNSKFPIRALLVLPGAYGRPGGIEAYNRLVIRAFSEIAAESGGACEALVLNDAPGDVHETSGGVKPVPFDHGKPQFAAAVMNRVWRFGPTLIFWGHVHFAPLAGAVALMKSAPEHWFVIYGVDAWKRLSVVHRAVLARADQILSISEFTRSEFASWNGIDASRIELLPCALDPEWAAGFSPQIEQLSNRAIEQSLFPHLLSVARLSKWDAYKGIDQVLRALPAVRSSVPDVRYTIVGDGDDRPRLERLARELGVASQVDFRGRVGPGELSQAYSDCSLFVMPSSKEGFGIVYLEAAYFGKPSIAGRHGGAVEVVIDGVTGLVVEREDTERLGAAIVSMLQDPEGSRRMGSAARQRLEKLYTYDIFRERLAALLSAPEPARAMETAG